MGIRNPVKKNVYYRDFHQCRKCKARKNLQLHHVLPRRLNGPDEEFNLVTLCQLCHTMWHKIELAADIGLMEKRVVEMFYSWLKYDNFPTMARIHIENCKIWMEHSKAKYGYTNSKNTKIPKRKKK